MMSAFGRWVPPTGVPPPGGGGGNIAFEQELGQAASAGTSFIILQNAGAGVPAGSLVVVVVWDNWLGPGVVGEGTIADDQGNTYTLVGQLALDGTEGSDPTFNGNLLIYASVLASDLANGESIIYSTEGANTDNVLRIAAAEFSGADDAGEDTSDAFNAGNAGTLTTTQAALLVTAVARISGSGITAGANWTNLTGIETLDWMYRIVDAAGAYGTPFTSAAEHAAVASALPGT